MSDHTSVEISSPHYCDFCGDVGTETVAKVEAKYDAATEMGPWADMCEAHYRRYGIGLGLGLGQRLILKTK